MWTSIGECYRQSARIMVALPLLFALPALTEIMQHVIEYRIGMFAGIEGLRAADAAPARMAYGQLKVLSLFLMLYWVSRALALGRGRVLGDRRSALLFAGVVLVSFGLGAVQMFGGDLVRPWLRDTLAQVAAGVAIYIGAQVIDTYLSVWKVGAALGNGALSIPASFRIMRGNFWWSFGFLVAIALPPLILHYLLNFAAVGRPEAILWPMLIADALFVGYIGILFATAAFTIARRAAGRAGVALT